MKQKSASTKYATPLVAMRFALPENIGLAMSADSVSQAITEYFEEFAQNVGFTRMFAFAYAPKNAQLRGAMTVGLNCPQISEIIIALADFPAVDRALKTHSPILLSNLSGLPSPLAESLEGRVAVVPISLAEYPLAILVGQLKANALNAPDAWRKQCASLALQAAFVVKLDRVFAAQQNEMRLRNATHTIVTGILEGKPLAETAANVTSLLSQLLRVSHVALYLRNSAGQMRLTHSQNLTPELEAQMMRLSPDHPLLVAREDGAPTFHPTLLEENLATEQRALLERTGISTALTTALQYGDVLQGILVLYPEEGREFSLIEISIFQAFTEVATLGIALTYQITQQRMLAINDERNRLAREMHDTVAQSLAGLALQIETVQTYFASGRDLEGMELLAESQALARKALEDTRRAVQGLSPSSLEHLTPVEAIAAEVHRFQEEAQITAQFRMSGIEVVLPSEAQVALLRIVQEALANIRRHSRASLARVGLKFDARTVTLLVEDDGVGFDAENRKEPSPEGGYGLYGMMERARLIGGEIHIESVLGWGTRIRTEIPLPTSSPSTLPIQPLENSTPPIKPLLTSPPETYTDRLRVLLADDHAVIRQGVRSLLEATGEVTIIGEAEDGEQAVLLTRTLRPDVLLMDVQMPKLDGIAALKRIMATLPDTPVVLLSAFPNEVHIREALTAGARGYLLKDSDSAQILRTLQAAFRGETLLSPRIAHQLSQTPASAVQEGWNERTLEVLQLLAQGTRNREIAAKLYISERTVEYHLSNIFAKLGVSNRTEAARAALERGLVTHSSSS